MEDLIQCRGFAGGKDMAFRIRNGTANAKPWIVMLSDIVDSP